MSHNAFRRILVVWIGVLIAVTSALAQDSSALVGKWNMTSESSGDPVNWTLVLKETDGKLAAYLTTDGSETAAKDFSYKDGVLRFKAPYQGQYYDIELKPNGTKLNGTWSGGGDSGETHGSKAS